jgi:hypothetical protein
MIIGMTEREPAAGLGTRIGVGVAAAMTAVGVCFTLLLFATAIYLAISFAADDELGMSTWSIVAWIAVLGAVSGLATTYLGRRAFRQS